MKTTLVMTVKATVVIAVALAIGLAGFHNPLFLLAAPVWASIGLGWMGVN